MSVAAFDNVGIVIIGRNEADRLRQSLPAMATCRAIVYVDSGSTDGSADVARLHGARVVQLDRSTGFTAARARNAGFEDLRRVAPTVTYVQFLDGDCLLADGWLEQASSYLDANPSYAAVCGRRQEEHPTRNLFHRITDREWDTVSGEAAYFGGDVLIRTDALSQVGGYRGDLIAGEEPELSIRLRRARWRIQRLDCPMSVHDIRMDSLGQWWQRSVRAGYAFAEGAALHGAGPERHWVKERRSIIAWGLMLPAIAIALAWPTYGLSLLIAVTALLLLFLKAAIGLHRFGRRSLSDSLLYAAHCVASKAPQAVGVFRYWVGRRSKPKLIEYRKLPACGG
jgi:glycosyltransferase involved in cell wall biosynthesis